MNDHDFTFSFDGAAGPGGPWSHLRVIRFRGHEEISALYRYEIIVLARTPAPEVDPRDLLGRSATLRIKTLTSPAHHVVHGIIAEAEELYAVPDGMQYRLVLAPPIARALFRKRCRIFLEKTTRQIIDAVLQGDPLLAMVGGAEVLPDSGDMSSFSAPAEQYTWRVSESPRIDRVTARPYCVQYNESDFAFFSRILEEEGISYHYENGDGVCLLVLADKDAGRAKIDGPVGPGVPGREVSSMRLGGRLRAKSVSLADYNWKQPAVKMVAKAGDDAAGAGLAEYSYPGNYPDPSANGLPLATAQVERYEVEAEYASGEGRLRILSAGAIVSLANARPNHEGSYLVTKLDVTGEQAGVSQEQSSGGGSVPFRCVFECARVGPSGSKFRPARVTAAPRIHGSQTAFVTAEPNASGAIVNVGDQVGCVRLRFHWDTDAERLAKEPSSCWVRVNQAFAGAGEGGVFHPRVGVEVIVEFLEGNPDRPIVTGRVYNAANMPPAPSSGSPTVSTWKSFSVPGGAQYNEILFDDAAGAEEIKMHAGKDWNTVVEHDRTEFVKNDSSSTVAKNRSEVTGENRHTVVGSNNTERVGDNDMLSVGMNQTATIGSNQGIFVGGNQMTIIDGWQTIDIREGYQKVDIKQSQDVTVRGEKQWFHIEGTQDFDVGGSIQYAAEKESGMSSKLGQSFSDSTRQVFSAPHQIFKAAMTELGDLQKQEFTSLDFIVTADNSVNVNATQAVHVGSGEGMVVVHGKKFLHLGSDTTVHIFAGNVAISGGSVAISGGDITIKGGEGCEVNMSGTKVNVTSAATDVKSDGDINVKGKVVRLNC